MRPYWGQVATPILKRAVTDLQHFAKSYSSGIANRGAHDIYVVFRLAKERLPLILLNPTDPSPSISMPSILDLVPFGSHLPLATSSPILFDRW